MVQFFMLQKVKGPRTRAEISMHQKHSLDESNRELVSKSWLLISDTKSGLLLKL